MYVSINESYKTYRSFMPHPQSEIFIHYNINRSNLCSHTYPIFTDLVTNTITLAMQLCMNNNYIHTYKGDYNSIEMIGQKLLKVTLLLNLVGHQYI